MGDKKINEVGTVTTLSDSEYVLVTLADGGLSRIKKRDLIKASSDAIKTILDSGLQVSGYQSAQGGLFFSPDKWLGISVVDGDANVLLIAPIIDAFNTKEDWVGCVGRFQFGRGNFTASNNNYYADIVLTKAYNSSKGFCYSNWIGLKVGYCIYNNQSYLAIYFPPISTFGISFSGRFSGNCVFMGAKYADVTGWKDL